MTNIKNVTIENAEGTATVSVTDSSGSGIGGLDVNIQDQYTGMIDLLFMRFDDTFTLAADAVKDDITITVTGGHSITHIAPEDHIILRDGVRYSQFKVLNVATNTITLDSPIDCAYAAADTTGENGPTNMAVNGSVTPQVFAIKVNTDIVSPATALAWDIVRTLYGIESDAQPDATKFGDIAGGLTNGCVLRYENGNSFNIFNLKTNGDFALRMYDTSYDDRSGPQNDFFFRARRTFGGASKTGVVVRLFGNGPDELQMIISDNLTSLTSFFVVAQGHIVE